jgi:hypothetical protein
MSKERKILGQGRLLSPVRELVAGCDSPNYQKLIWYKTNVEVFMDTEDHPTQPWNKFEGDPKAGHLPRSWKRLAIKLV